MRDHDAAVCVDRIAMTHPPFPFAPYFPIDADGAATASSLSACVSLRLVKHGL
jgi:hypothetical protein